MARYDQRTWEVLRAGAAAGHDLRIVLKLRDGRLAADDAKLVAAAAEPSNGRA